MLIGSWGDLVFEVSGKQAKTFSALTQEASGRWAEHNPINTAPLSQFLGPGLGKVEMEMTFSTMLGVDPQKCFDSLEANIKKGENHPLILGGIPLSQKKWYLKDISGKSEFFAAGTGVILWMEVTAHFVEYH